MEALFLACLFLVFYTYFGYGIIVWMLVRIRGRRRSLFLPDFIPDISLIIPAYNELSILPEKVANSLALDYPANKLHILFVTEGSTDGSTEYLTINYPGRIQVMGGHERQGKVAAMNRAMAQVSSPIVVFTDANTYLNPQAVSRLVRHFADPEVGAVAGEKRILTQNSESAAGSGEGLYWKYESLLKRLDSELKTIVGAAGELFAVRTDLYEHTEPDTILDDFIISLRIAGRGYRVAYEPDAYALESPSFSIRDEKKRKIRIAAGGFQSIVRLAYLLNPVRYGLLTFEYVSHRVMRWAVAPFCLPLLFVNNGILAAQSYASSGSAGNYWTLLFLLQCMFYGAAAIGYWLEDRQLRWKLFFVPFYFAFMNGCALAGWVRYINGKQSGIWEKVRRAEPLQMNA